MAKIKTKRPNIMTQKKTKSVGLTSFPSRPHVYGLDDVGFSLALSFLGLKIDKSEKQNKKYIKLFMLLEMSKSIEIFIKAYRNI